jgi:HAD superfamily hydrolase (TIGR01509 family)
MALELRDLPRAALEHLSEAGHIPELGDRQWSAAEAAFQEARAAAEASLRETSHIDDLMKILEALHLRGRVPDAVIAETVDRLHRRCLPTVELMPHVPAMLRRLHKLGVRLGIVSNAAYAPFLAWTLERFAILDFFEDIVVSADVAARKPGHAIFRIALERMGLAARAVAYVGDDFVKDVIAPKQLNMRAVWYRPDGGPAPPAIGVRPDATVASHAEIPSLAVKWRGTNNDRL